ncbi:MAG: hypothetical protein WC121_00035 [Candidatus Kapaibacterium sp.]
MKKLILTMTALVSFSVIFSSCSDDKTTNPVTKENYFATTQGSYWIYENETEDETQGKVVTKDSVALESVEPKDGKEAYNCKTYTDSDNNGSYETKSGTETFYATAEGKLYIHKDAFLPDGLGEGSLLDLSDQIEFKDDWIKIADASDDDWDIVESKIDLTISGLGFGIKGDLDSEGENMNKTKEITVNGVALTTYGYKVDINFTGNISADAVPIPLPIKFTSSTTYWVAKGIGPVLIETSPVDIADGLIPSQPGTTSTLKTYFIAK